MAKRLKRQNRASTSGPCVRTGAVLWEHQGSGLLLSLLLLPPFFLYYILLLSLTPTAIKQNTNSAHRLLIPHWSRRFPRFLTNLIQESFGDVVKRVVGKPAVSFLETFVFSVEELARKRLCGLVKEKRWTTMGGVPDCWRRLKDIVHVNTAVSFLAEPLDVKLADFFNHVVATLNVKQLARVCLHI